MRIVFIGGGSFQWTPTLVTDVLTMPSLAGAELVLEDIDPKPLPVMERYARRVADELGAGATVRTTTDQRDALAGADAVVVCISTGGFQSMRHDLAVPERFGLRQAVGDTVGPGGINRVLRNVPVLDGIARDVAELCPDAWLLNITNPMSCLTRAAASIHPRTVGLCHEVFHFRLDLALLLGRPDTDIELTIGGVNHLPVITRLTIDGEDGFPTLLAAAADGRARDDRDEHRDEPWRSRTRFARSHQVKLALLERHGALPGAGDRHVVEFFPGFLTEASGWGREWGVHLTTIDEREADQARYVENVELQLTGQRAIPRWQSGEMVAPILDSLVTGTRRELPLNLPNEGQLAGVPAGAVVETMCVVDAAGVRPRGAVTLPSPFDEWARRHTAVQELAVQAARTGDRALALEAFTLDPLAGRGDLRVTEAMVDELLAATAPWLPQFHPPARQDCRA